MVQIAQTAACYRHHTAEQQVSRWLLATLDRMPKPGELLGSLLGVRRETITQVAGRLQQQGLICCRRRHISVTDAPGLVHTACECYRAMRLESQRLGPPGGH
jgi:CRP-like cAMP-binding protein